MKAAAIPDTKLQTLLEGLRQRHGVVGASAGILRYGQMELAASGVLNLDTGVRATTDSVFQIGSIGKVFTATLIMQLLDEGRLTLDEPVRTWLPDFAIADEQAATRITPRMLLCHLSGMEGDFFPPDDPEGPSNLGYFRKLRLLPQLMQPGEEPMAYCNSGYMVAGRLIEKLTGLTWESAVIERICRPLGMNTAFTNPKEALRFRCAMGHSYDAEDVNKTVVASSTYLPLSTAAAGAVLSMSAPDLLRFAQVHLADGDAGGGTRMLSAASARAMREPLTMLPDFSLPEFNAWGLGWMVGAFDDYRSCGPDGATLGQFTYLRLFPERQLAIALLMNSPSAPMFLEFMDQAMEITLGLQRPAEPPAEIRSFDPARYVGEYACLSALHRVCLKADRLNLTLVDTLFQSPPVETLLTPYRPDVFSLDTDNPRYRGTKIRFLGADDQNRALYSRMTVRMLRRQ